MVDGEPREAAHLGERRSLDDGLHLARVNRVAGRRPPRGDGQGSRAPGAQTRTWSSWRRAAGGGRSRAPPRRRAGAVPSSGSVGGARTGGLWALAAVVAAIQHLGQGRLERLELLLEQQDLLFLCREPVSGRGGPGGIRGG